MTPQLKPTTAELKTKWPELKPKTPELKGQDHRSKTEPKPRTAELKTPELKPTTAELKHERPELKPKTPELKPKTAEVKPRDNWIPVEPRNRSPAARKSPLGGSEIWSKWLPKGSLEASGRALDGLWEALGAKAGFRAILGSIEERF